MEQLNSAQVKKQERIDSYGFAGSAYNQIIVFKDGDAFRQILDANPNMVAIIGASEETIRNFPGVYIAGIKADAGRVELSAHKIGDRSMIQFSAPMVSIKNGDLDEFLKGFQEALKTQMSGGEPNGSGIPRASAAMP